MKEANSSREKPLKKRTSRWRISIRTSLILMTFIAIATVCYQHRVRAIEAFEDVADFGATIEFHPDSMPLLNSYTGGFFRNVSAIEFPQDSSPDDVLVKLKYLPHLHRLSLPDSSAEKEGFEHISNCRELRELLISGCRHFEDSSVDSIKQLAKLNKLDVSDTNLTSTGAKKLGSIESLRHFTFSCTDPNQLSSELVPRWYSGEKLRSMSRPDLMITMIGKAHLEKLDDQSIARLAEMDTAQLNEVHIRDSELSSGGVSVVSKMESTLKRIRLENCKLHPRDLKKFDIKSTSLILEGTSLKVNDLINVLGTQFLTAKLGSSNTEFTTSASKLKVLIDDLADELEVDCFSQMPNLTHVDCFSRNKKSFLEAVEFSQPSIGIYVHLRTEDRNVNFWDTIKATPSLTGLSVFQPPGGICPQFTTEHQLKSFHLYKVPDDPSVLSEEFFQEIAKLNLLEWFTIRNKLIIGKEILPVTTMAELERVEVGNLDDDAASLLLGMNLSDLNMSWDFLSPATIKRIRARR